MIPNSKASSAQVAFDWNPSSVVLCIEDDGRGVFEVVRESRGRLENNREDDISTIGTQAEEKATKGKKPEFAAHFQQTIEYRSQIADKAAATRKKNEAAEAEAAAEAAKQNTGP